MLDLTSQGVVRALLGRHGLSPQKALGQNFIVSPALCPRIAEEGGARAGVGALEIGPGIGALTTQLAARCEKVVAIEIDKGLIPLLAETLAPHLNAEVVHADALKLDLPLLVREKFGVLPFIVCANLPYYITSALVMRLLESGIPAQSITVMVQKDVALRFCAPLPSRGAGAVTAAIAWRAEVRRLFDVSPGSFFPRPEVESSVIQLTPRAVPPYPVRDEALLFGVIRAAFSQRRKTLLNCLSSALAIPKAEVAAALEAAQVDPRARAEQLALADFAKIADGLSALVYSHRT